MERDYAARPTGNSQAKAAALARISRSINYTGKGIDGTFDFDRCDIGERIAAVKDALSLPGSMRSAPLQASMPIMGGMTLGDLDFARWGKKKQNPMKKDLGNGNDVGSDNPTEESTETATVASSLSKATGSTTAKASDSLNLPNGT